LKNSFTLLLALLCFGNSGFSQPITLNLSDYRTSIETPYRLDKKKDLAIGLGASALIITGLIFKGIKPATDSLDIINSDISKIPSFDRSAIHQSNGTYQSASDILEITALALPFVAFVDKRVSGHAPQIILLYLETLSLDFAAYNMTTGIVNRRRPLTYNTDSSINEAGVLVPDVPFGAKLTSGAQESFFSGHTSIAATATFFGARVFTDLRPQSKLVPFVWGAAIFVPGFVGFSRYKAGKHFPSDVVTGYLIGAAIGYLNPTLHKIKLQDRLSFYPMFDNNGFGMTYNF
jgi:membrane-associated phospholipid phosphatase